MKEQLLLMIMIMKRNTFKMNKKKYKKKKNVIGEGPFIKKIMELI